LRLYIVQSTMNNMKSKLKKNKTSNQLKKLSLSIGDFIRYWGFRRVHGAIWAQLYLSKIPLSCTDLTVNLGLSKALISPALEELCQYKLIFEAPAPNDKVRVYSAEQDVNEVIRQILKTRELKILKQIARDFSDLKQRDFDGSEMSLERLDRLEEMIFSANVTLELIIDQKDLMRLPF
jgi:DNA-binding transcriptional regulator GbsR (MarR family)